MKSYRYCIVDVFAEEPYTGNQLGVVFDDGTLDDAAMLAITQEMHYSETVFIAQTSMEQEEKPIRIFTPPAEVHFAGHPCLGSAFCIERALRKAGKTVTGGLKLKTKAGCIPITIERRNGKTVWWMKQVQPSFGNSIPVHSMTKLLGLDEKQFDARYPVQWVSTGLPFLIVPLAGIDAVRNVKVDWELFHAKLSAEKPGDILVFTRETDDRHKDLHVRVFVDFPGIPEDPATGSANGCLAAYIVRYGYMHADVVEYQVEQGIELGRPSVLHVRAHKQAETYSIEVGGEVHFVAEGTLYK